MAVIQVSNIVIEKRLLSLVTSFDILIKLRGIILTHPNGVVIHLGETSDYVAVIENSEFERRLIGGLTVRSNRQFN